MEKRKKIVIIIGVILFLGVVFAVSLYAFNRAYKKNIQNDFKTVTADGVNTNTSENKDRLNVLVLGMEHTRTDTIMVATFDPVSKTLNMISIPRDTYVENEYRDGTLKKINSVYEFPKVEGGIERLASHVSKILGIPIHDYIMVDYNAVAQLTQAVGGVDVEIPFNMYYDDPWSDPPLHVYFKKGQAHLNGKNAIEYLRWRHNSDGSHGNEGDEGRVKRQQDFMKKMLEKALNPTTLPKVIDVAFKNVKTSLDLSKAMGLVTDLASMPKENIRFYQEVGSPSYFNSLWYYMNDEEKTQALVQKIINNTTITDEDLNPSAQFLARAERGFGRRYSENTQNRYTEKEYKHTKVVKKVENTAITPNIFKDVEKDKKQEEDNKKINDSVVVDGQQNPPSQDDTKTKDTTPTDNQRTTDKTTVTPPENTNKDTTTDTKPKPTDKQVEQPQPPATQQPSPTPDKPPTDAPIFN